MEGILIKNVAIKKRSQPSESLKSMSLYPGNSKTSFSDLPAILPKLDIKAPKIFWPAQVHHCISPKYVFY